VGKRGESWAGVLGVVSADQFPGGRGLFVAAVVDAIGSGSVIPVSVLFFTLYKHISPASVGVGLTVSGLVALLLTPLAGMLIDHLGAKHALVGFWGLAAAAFVGYGSVASWLELVLAVSCSMFASSASSTARKTLIAELVDEEHLSTVLASQRVIRNAGYGIGGLLATAALATGTLGFLVIIYGNAGSYLIALALLTRTPSSKPPDRSYQASVSPWTGLQVVLSDRRYLCLTAADFLTSFQGTALEVALPLWIALDTHAPRALVGILFTVNTICVVLVQVRLAAGVRALSDLSRTYRRAVGLMVLAAGALLAAHYVGEIPAVALLTGGVLVMTGTEMLSSAGEWVVSFDLAADAHRGSYLSVFSTGGSLESAIGPVVVTALITAGPGLLWPVLATMVCTGMLLTGLTAHHTLTTTEANEPERGLTPYKAQRP
jgi:hypothetical protein